MFKKVNVLLSLVFIAIFALAACTGATPAAESRRPPACHSGACGYGSASCRSPAAAGKGCGG
jgi:hypothetical protein